MNEPTAEAASSLSELVSEDFVSDLAGQLGKQPADVSESLSRFKSVEDLAKSYVHLHSKAGKPFSVPGADASATEVLEYRKKIGAPETKDGYEIPDNAARRGFLEKMREAADSRHMTSDQWQAIVENANQDSSDARQSVIDAWASQRESMSENQQALADRGIQQFLSADLAEFLIESGVHQDPRIVRGLAEIAAADARGAVTVGGQEGVDNTSRVQEVDAEIAELRSNKEYKKGRGAGYVSVRDQITALYKEKERLGAPSVLK